jgi:hypothetical protein
MTVRLLEQIIADRKEMCPRRQAVMLETVTGQPERDLLEHLDRGILCIASHDT